MTSVPKPEQLAFNLGHRQAQGREDFWVSVCNKDAVAWLDKWPDWPGPALVIFGPASCGKTHLLQVWKKGKGDKAVILDDASKIAGDRAEEEALFHLYNRMKEQGGHLLLAAEKPVKEWPLVLPDLKSRLLAEPAVAIGSPDDELMAVVLTKLFSDRQIFVPQEVVQFILSRIERSFLALREIADKIDRKALSEKRPVTIPLVREIM